MFRHEIRVSGQQVMATCSRILDTLPSIGHVGHGVLNGSPKTRTVERLWRTGQDRGVEGFSGLSLNAMLTTLGGTISRSSRFVLEGPKKRRRKGFGHHEVQGRTHGGYKSHGL